MTDQGKFRVISFLRCLIKDAGRMNILILDNLRVHHAKLGAEWVAKREDQIELHYLPSYSSDLNPGEYLNCDLKGKLHEEIVEIARAGEELFQSETNSMRSRCRRINNG